MLTLHPSTVDSQIAFENAIGAGHFSSRPADPNFAGLFMFMGEDDNGALVFKNRNTREYIALADLA